MFFRFRKSRTEKMMDWFSRMFKGMQNMFKRIR